MRTLPFTSLLSSFTYRRGMQREADWSWKTQRQHYYLRKNEREKSFLKTVNIRKWCMILSASQSTSLKWGSSVQRGNRSRRQSVYSDFVSFSCQNSVVISTFSSGAKSYFLVKESKLSSINLKRHKSLPHFHRWTPGPGTVTGGDNHTVHPFLIWCFQDA